MINVYSIRTRPYMNLLSVCRFSFPTNGGVGHVWAIYQQVDVNKPPVRRIIVEDSKRMNRHGPRQSVVAD